MQSLNSKADVRVELIEIHPDTAKAWLENRNERNRPIRDNVVSALARDILADRFRITNQGIGFDSNNALVDGQHRLAAIVRANVPVKMFVFENLDPDTLLAIDQGVTRTTSDILTLQGGLGKVSRSAVGTLRAMLRAGYAAGEGSYRKRTVQEERDLYIEHRNAIDFAEEPVKKRFNGTRGVGGAVVRGVVARAWYSVDTDRLRRFQEILCTGIASNDGEVGATLLWKHLVEQGRTSADTKSRRDRHLRTERALQAFVNKEQLKKLRPASCELFPLPQEIAQ